MVQVFFYFVIFYFEFGYQGFGSFSVILVFEEFLVRDGKVGYSRFWFQGVKVGLEGWGQLEGGIGKGYWRRGRWCKGFEV